jgi:hypothetical protein
MKKKILYSLLTIMVTFFCACNSSPNNRQLEKETNLLDEAAETEAIMKVIAGETECFFKGHYECWTKYWSHEKYVFQGWNYSDGTADVAIGWDDINSRGKDYIEKYYENGDNVVHPIVKREKPLIKFLSNKLAYLIWKQYNSDKEKTNFTTSQEVRIMEKSEDGWKIVNVSSFWDTQPKIPFDSLQIK